MAIDLNKYFYRKIGADKWINADPREIHTKQYEMNRVREVLSIGSPPKYYIQETSTSINEFRTDYVYSLEKQEQMRLEQIAEAKRFEEIKADPLKYLLTELRAKKNKLEKALEEGWYGDNEEIADLNFLEFIDELLKPLEGIA